MRKLKEQENSSQGALYPTRITDANGNYITIAYRNDTGPEIETVTDTLGRTISFHYDRWQNLLTAVTGPGYGGGTRTLIRLNYTDLQLTYEYGRAFQTGLVPVVPDPMPSFIKAIYYPGTATGYWFGDQYSYSSYGMVAKVTEQRGMGFSGAPPIDQGTITPGTKTWERTYDYPFELNPNLQDAPTYEEMSEDWADQDSNRVWTFYSVNQSASERRVETRYPDGSRHVQLSYNASGWEDGLVSAHMIFDNNGKLLRRTSMEWEQGDYKSPRLLSIDVMDELNRRATTEYTYNTPFRNEVSEVREYDYEVADRGRLLRRTRMGYKSYEERHIFGLPNAVEIYDGASSELTSLTRYEYDDSALADRPGVVGHSDPGSTSRGNVTKVITYADAARDQGAITETRQYDITGNLISTSTSSDRQTSYSYTKDTQYAYPTAQTAGSYPPDPSTQVKTEATYDFNTGLLKSTTDANGRTTERTYYSESLRLQKVILPTGATTTYDYKDQNVPIGASALMVTETTRNTSGQIAAKSRVQLNGLGLVKRQEVLAEEAPEAWDVTITQYDGMGRLWRLWVPGRGSPSGRWKEISYDKLGRVMLVKAPDGSEVRSFYNEPSYPSDAPTRGQTERVVDAWGRERWTLTDALGRLRAVVEPNPGGNGSVFEAGNVVTSYDYNALDNVVAIRRADQQWTFRYDSLGRLTYQHLPEKSATLDDAGQYVGVGGEWSDVFTYDDCSNLATYTDARGVKTVYDYMFDPLCRLRSVSYNTEGAPKEEGVLPASNVSYEYETTGDLRLPSLVKTDDVSEEYRYDAEGRLSSKSQVIAGSDPRPLELGYAYDDLDRLWRVDYPAAYGTLGESRSVVEYEYGPASRLRGLKVGGRYYASQITHNAAGQMESLKVGGQITEDYAYNATGMLDHQGVKRGGASLLDLSYDYQRLGDSNNWKTGQLTRITDNVDTQKGRGYEYDALGRLVRARGGSDLDAPLWRQEYSYDTGGNRTSVTATGNTADGTAIPPDGMPHVDYDVETNRIITSGFAYDAAGNPTRVQREDGTWQRYQYDAAGRLARVCDDAGNVLEDYVYGANSQRLRARTRKAWDSPIYYVCSGAKILAEHVEELDAGGEKVFRWWKDYVYLGGRLLFSSGHGSGGVFVEEYYHPDRLGTRLVTNETYTAVQEQVALPFGTHLEKESTGETNPRFTSYDRSATTGLDYAVNRYYDPQLGRFTQVDPLGTGGFTVSDPQSLNLYSYVRNDLVNNIDPLGLDFNDCQESIAFCGGGYGALLPGGGAGYDPNIGFESTWGIRQGSSRRPPERTTIYDRYDYYSRNVFLGISGSGTTLDPYAENILVIGYGNWTPWSDGGLLDWQDWDLSWSSRLTSNYNDLKIVGGIGGIATALRVLAAEMSKASISGAALLSDAGSLGAMFVGGYLFGRGVDLLWQADFGLGWMDQDPILIDVYNLGARLFTDEYEPAYDPLNPPPPPRRYDWRRG